MDNVPNTPDVEIAQILETLRRRLDVNGKREESAYEQGKALGQEIGYGEGWVDAVKVILDAHTTPGMPRGLRGEALERLYAHLAKIPRDEA
jgi:hypothetical protein